ncbi:hypothetical protein GXW71_00290 [Roseomonas hellenica]|uniref:Uncharacterized protein n=1 Tax=Plastoroseomonas hellenica TaxID=2687306 RepID=A0ABS5ER49_9PROT|nr:hypothetical protein [Plastoroseomonas hellenica]MBR0662780.1 hypothetical protein [Plastoroseomonas hellenica]
MSAHFASVLVPASKTSDISTIADLAALTLQDLIATLGDDAMEVANLQAAVEGIRHALKTHATRPGTAMPDVAIDRAQLSLIISAAAGKAVSFDARAAVMVAESCL